MPEPTQPSRHEFHEEGSVQPSHAEISAPSQALDADWRLNALVQAVGEDVAQQFFWKAETGTIQTYEHRLTYRYVHLDGLTGQFCDQQRQPISAELALAHAMPRLQAAPAQLVLAPVVLELDLHPFVRRADLGAEERSPVAAAGSASARPARLVSVATSAFHRLRSKFLVIGTYAKPGGSVPKRESAVDVRGNREANDLSLAAFTRRTA